MILKFYKQSLPLAPASLMIWVVLLAASGYFYAQHIVLPEAPVLPILHNLLGIITSNQWLSVIIAVVIIYFEARLINAITFEKELLGQKNKLPHLFFVLLFFCTTNYAHLHIINLANLFLILMIREIMNLQYPVNIPSSIYKSGFYLGCAAIFFPIYSYYLPFVITCLVIFKHNNLRRWFICIFGFFTPILYLWVFSFFLNKNSNYIFDFLNLLFVKSDIFVASLINKKEYLFLALYLGILLLFSILATVKIYQSEISRHKYAKQSILVLTGGAILVLFSLGQMPTNALGAPIFAILLSFFFSWVKKWWIGEILLYLWLLIIGLYNIPNF